MPIFNSTGVDLFYSVKGNGIPIVFIHPPVLTSINFIYQMEELSSFFKVITFDIRGHGNSESSLEPLSYPLIVEDIKRLMKHLEIEKAYICGYSTGGSIVLEFLLSAGEMALGGIVIGGMSEVMDQHLKRKISIGRYLSKSKAVPVLALSVCRSNANPMSLFFKMYAESIKGNAKNIEQYYRYSLHYKCTDQLHTIKHPLLLVYGKDDKRFHDYANLLHQKLPFNELKFIDNVKHQIPTKTSKELNKLITNFVHSQ
ncbi:MULTISPECIES: alpha/beta fold hydrolase [unclassified Bacillus (in: firmicutes)]|uniref:alpha/beta fold hydrolase n=1 Tax=unclassified Bacillus (in: firmicutes) TaxID=185979 RepID=UPI0008EC6DD5|nr:MULTISPECIES: alpha/beta hydrolase [unclassified Bacillus (in: firmicutes)]SFB20624.1 Pimeloyl-ACP methyl ester carboxylesterase [Bacillus sp. UNCCL13]SFQ90887.1 Pimeloyl-ACP methyl ester carboxylesterase [Bacillus sp. cl95]